MNTEQPIYRSDANHRVAMHSTLRPLNSGQSSFNLESELLDVTVADLTEEECRKRFRSAAIKSTRAVGACHLQKLDSVWGVQHSSGRIPTQQSLIEELGESFDEKFSGQNPTAQKLTCLDDLTAIFVPVKGLGAVPELFMLVVADPKSTAMATASLKRVTTAIELWMKGKFAKEAEWQNASLASIIELVGKIENSDTVKSGTNAVVNEMARWLKCDCVAIAIRKKENLKLCAISGVHKLDKGSTTCRNFLEAAFESSVRTKQAIFPPLRKENDHLLLAHMQLAGTTHCEAVLSQPLVTPSGDEVGVWVFTGSKNLLHHPHFSSFVQTATPHIASALEILARSEMGVFRRALAFVRNKTSLLTRFMIPIAIALSVLLMMVPVTYRVRCNCATETVSRRFAVAPFDGLIASAFVEPGDLVTKGDALAEMDGRNIRWELSGVTAERQQSVRQRAIELADENIPSLFLAELENKRLASQEEILKFKKEKLTIKSPIDGVVLSGSLERSEAASVETGQVLFEVGPIDAIKIQIEIPADEISQVQTGHEVTIWIEGQEDEPLEAAIETIHPRSTIRNGNNVFLAELKFVNEHERMRPGMKGTVRIDCEQRSLGWSLFHKPINYARSRLSWW